jgi:hypothetical protein
MLPWSWVVLHATIHYEYGICMHQQTNWYIEQIILILSTNQLFQYHIIEIEPNALFPPELKQYPHNTINDWKPEKSYSYNLVPLNGPSIISRSHFFLTLGFSYIYHHYYLFQFYPSSCPFWKLSLGCAVTYGVAIFASLWSSSSCLCCNLQLQISQRKQARQRRRQRTTTTCGEFRPPPRIIIIIRP